MTRAQRREERATRRRVRKYRERLQQEHMRAQSYLRALEQALVDWGRPETLAVEGEWRLKAPAKRLGKIFGLMFPTGLSGRTSHALTQGRVWDQHLPSRILGALPQQKWVRQLQHRRQDLFATLWHHVEDKSSATRSRWQWTWVGDDRVVKKSGQQLGLVGAWYSGQEHRVRRGIDGLLLVVVIGNGKLVVPVDLVVRRPDPVGPGRPGRDQRPGLQVMLDRTWAALQPLGLRLPPPLVVADRWCGDSTIRAHVAGHRQGMLLVEGKRSSVFHLRDGRRMTGQDLRTLANWPWRESSQVPGVR